MNIRNPRTGKFDYVLQSIDTNGIRSKTISLRAAQPNWLDKGIDFRAKTLHHWKELLEDYYADLLEALIDDTGRKAESEQEISYVFRAIEHWSIIAQHFLREPEVMATSIEGLQLENHYESFPLVGVISGWCFPLAHLMKEIIPALLAGSTVIAKPSCTTPRFLKVINHTIYRTKGLKEVLAVVEGDDELLEPLCKAVDFVCYNGTDSEAKTIADITHRFYKKASIQHGKKNTVIVTESADLEAATTAILQSGFWNAGQSSSSVERVYVHRNVYHLFLSRLVGKTNLIKLAYPTTESGQIGPIIAESQINRINDQLWDALEKGARLLTGIGQCEKWEGGYYCRPTIMVNVTPEMKIMQEETLAPILPIMLYQDADELQGLVNGQKACRSGAIFARQAQDAIVLGKTLGIAVLSVNDIALEEFLEVAKHTLTSKNALDFESYFSDYRKFFNRKTFIINQQNPLIW